MNQPVTTRRALRGSRVPATSRTPCGSRGSNTVSRLNAGSTAVTCAAGTLGVVLALTYVLRRCKLRMQSGPHAINRLANSAAPLREGCDASIMHGRIGESAPVKKEVEVHAG